MSKTEDLGPMPEPTVSEPELVPGGIDAVYEDEPVTDGRDLDPGRNPSVDDVLPPEVSAPDEKKQAPEGHADDQEAGTEVTPDAGQEAEDGSVEPPA
ncbi:hypothetical protein DDE18_20560 [Nocardioides gansuensis]|uniref:Uncharacterized protein n=1 Tax=Nocardioides gansuensis TaxID=2138300 RepID=A0A2T8F5H9_9ACTN|nr:hypothetical protein [Nocardioides gansuensis]PVG80956.1 hypothetical protein DDE18_20560 [Nocardioides gansuensis]